MLVNKVYESIFQKCSTQSTNKMEANDGQIKLMIHGIDNYFNIKQPFIRKIRHISICMIIPLLLILKLMYIACKNNIRSLLIALTFCNPFLSEKYEHIIISGS